MIWYDFLYDINTDAKHLYTSTHKIGYNETQRNSIARIFLSLSLHLRRCKMSTTLVVGQSDDEYRSRCFSFGGIIIASNRMCNRHRICLFWLSATRIIRFFWDSCFQMLCLGAESVLRIILSLYGRLLGYRANRCFDGAYCDASLVAIKLVTCQWRAIRYDIGDFVWIRKRCLRIVCDDWILMLFHFAMSISSISVAKSTQWWLSTSIRLQIFCMWSETVV